jgi:hypothetical protein
MSTEYRVLTLFDLPDADPFPSVLIEALATTEVVALGHYGLPEQTPPDAAREQFESDAREELTDLARPLENAGIPVLTQLVFNSTRQKAINRVARIHDCDAILTTGPVEALDRLFVALGGKAGHERILSFVADLLAATDTSVTLFDTREETLANATDRLLERGVDPRRIYQQLSERPDVGQRVVELEDNCDLLVISEPEPSDDPQVIGTVSAETTLNADDPAFIIRSPDRS